MGAEKTEEQRREIFRVCTAGALLNVKVEDYPECTLLDAHSEGFAVVLPEPIRIGVVVRIVLDHNGEEFYGRARVRNIAKLKHDRYRCGLQILPEEQELQRGLQLVAIAVQRDHLRRMSDRTTTQR